MATNNWSANARTMLTCYIRNYLNVHALVDFNLASPVLKLKLNRSNTTITYESYSGSTFTDKMNLNKIRSNADVNTAIYCP